MYSCVCVLLLQQYTPTSAKESLSCGHSPPSAQNIQIPRDQAAGEEMEIPAHFVRPCLVRKNQILLRYY